MTTDPQWLDWSKRLRAIAQNGLTFADDPFDVERYEAIRAIAAEMMAEQSNGDHRRLDDLFAAEHGYATPKLDVRAAVFRNDHILLVRERSDGGWTLPGGWVDVGDSPSEAIEREVIEESGYRVRAVKLLAMWDRNRHGHPPLPEHIYKVVFLCDLLDDEPVVEFDDHNIETDGVDFFARDQIPPLSQSRVMPEQIERIFELVNAVDSLTEFD